MLICVQLYLEIGNEGTKPQKGDSGHARLTIIGDRENSCWWRLAKGRKCLF